MHIVHTASFNLFCMTMDNLIANRIIFTSIYLSFATIIGTDDAGALRLSIVLWFPLNFIHLRFYPVFDFDFISAYFCCLIK